MKKAIKWEMVKLMEESLCTATQSALHPLTPSLSRCCLSVRSPALRSPRGGTPRRHLITPVPGSAPRGRTRPHTLSIT